MIRSSAFSCRKIKNIFTFLLTNYIDKYIALRYNYSIEVRYIAV